MTETKPRYRVVVPRSESTHIRISKLRLNQLRRLRELFPTEWATDTEVIDAAFEFGIRALSQKASRKRA